MMAIRKVDIETPNSALVVKIVTTILKRNIRHLPSFSSQHMISCILILHTTSKVCDAFCRLWQILTSSFSPNFVRFFKSFSTSKLSYKFSLLDFNIKLVMKCLNHVYVVEYVFCTSIYLTQMIHSETVRRFNLTQSFLKEKENLPQRLIHWLSPKSKRP